MCICRAAIRFSMGDKPAGVTVDVFYSCKSLSVPFPPNFNVDCSWAPARRNIKIHLPHKLLPTLKLGGEGVIVGATPGEDKH